MPLDRLLTTERGNNQEQVIPLIQYTLVLLCRVHIYANLYMWNTYNRSFIAPVVKLKTAFQTGEGPYEPLVMSFRLTDLFIGQNASMHRLSDHIFSNQGHQFGSIF